MQALTIGNSTGRALTTKTGKVAGQRFTFTGNYTAGELRATGRDMGLKGAMLNEYVNKALTDAQAAANAGLAVTVSALQSKGYIPDYTDIRAKSATVRFVKPTEVKPKDVINVDKIAEAFGMSAEDVRAKLNIK